ncbi:hypothetical protein OROHE_002223 [Orobanche hederae]
MSARRDKGMVQKLKNLTIKGKPLSSEVRASHSESRNWKGKGPATSVSDGAENAVVALKNKKKKPVETHFFNDENETINQIHVKPVYIPVGRLPRPCLKCSKEHDLNSHPCYMVRSRPLKDENSNQVPVDGLQNGQSLPCRECSEQHPHDSYCPCDVCYRPHPSGVCSYFRYVPQGAAFSPEYYLICQCGNLFDKDKWVCTFCGGGDAMLKAKSCRICGSYKSHNNYECPKDPAEAAVYKSIRDATIRRGPSVRIPYEEVCRSRISHAG